MNVSETSTQRRPARNLDELVNSVSYLVSPPEIHIRLEQVLESPHAGWQDMADVVSQDPNLSARLLKLANSAFHGHRDIATLSRAVALLGTRVLYDLAVGVAALGVFQKVPAELVDVSVFWRHSLYSAIIAKLLARRCNVLHPERLFVAGLLHDVGCLVLYMAYPEEMREALLVAKGDEDIMARKENELLGFDHAEVGARLLELWRLPEPTTQAIHYHHVPAQAPELTLEIAIVHLASILANRADEGSFSGEGSFATSPDPAALTLTGLSDDEAEELWSSVDAEFNHAVDVLQSDSL